MKFTKFTSEIADKIVALVRKGNMRKVAAARVKIAERTVKTWVAKGRENLERLEKGEVEDLDDFGLFVVELEQAEAEVRSRCEEGVIAAGETDWRAFAWHLKHRYPQEYSARVEVTGAEGKALFEGSRERLVELVMQKKREQERSGGPSA